MEIAGTPGVGIEVDLQIVVQDLCYSAGEGGGIKLRIPIATLIFFLLAGATTPALAAERRSANIDDRGVADFYRGKVVRIVVGFPPGGGADVYSRVLARHLGRFIPGNPTLAVTNMPGAGSIIAGNHIFNAGAKDGTEIGMLNGAVILEQLFGNPGVHFDMARFRYLAVPVTETYVMVVTRRSGITGFSEVVGANAKQAVLGAIPNSTLEHAPILLREALDANLKVVSGYKGSAEIRLAIDSEEIGGFFNPWSTVKASSLEKFTNGQWSVILQLSDQPLPDLPSSNVPTIRDLTRDESQRMLLRYGAIAPNQFGKVYMLRDGVPADRAAALEVAFARTFADRNFLADAEKSKLEITPLYGESIRQIVDDFLTMPTAVKDRLKRAIKR
jgi:tripartite-type tricarboxylate transporter receptor subunit TctC